jgi:hypothetical protein
MEQHVGDSAFESKRERGDFSGIEMAVAQQKWREADRLDDGDCLGKRSPAKRGSTTTFRSNFRCTSPGAMTSR